MIQCVIRLYIIHVITEYFCDDILIKGGKCVVLQYTIYMPVMWAQPQHTLLEDYGNKLHLPILDHASVLLVTLFVVTHRCTVPVCPHTSS